MIRNKKLIVAHCGDSGAVLGYSDNPNLPWKVKRMTEDHKPTTPAELARIEAAGGMVLQKAGVHRVVWQRPKLPIHKGPVRRSTQIDNVPFLAVARSLGDLWSYNSYNSSYIVSPEPDVEIYELDPTRDRCLVLASDGMWNMMTAADAVRKVHFLEKQLKERILNDPDCPSNFWINPAERLCHDAIRRWRARGLRADNTTAIVVMIDVSGESQMDIWWSQRKRILQAKEDAEARSSLTSPLSDVSSGADSPVSLTSTPSTVSFSEVGGEGDSPPRSQEAESNQLLVNGFQNSDDTDDSYDSENITPTLSSFATPHNTSPANSLTRGPSGRGNKVGASSQTPPVSKKASKRRSSDSFNNKSFPQNFPRVVYANTFPKPSNWKGYVPPQNKVRIYRETTVQTDRENLLLEVDKLFDEQPNERQTDQMAQQLVELIIGRVKGDTKSTSGSYESLPSPRGAQIPASPLLKGINPSPPPSPDNPHGKGGIWRLFDSCMKVIERTSASGGFKNPCVSAESQCCLPSPEQEQPPTYTIVRVSNENKPQKRCFSSTSEGSESTVYLREGDPLIVKDAAGKVVARYVFEDETTPPAKRRRTTSPGVNQKSILTRVRKSILRKRGLAEV